ncbi:MAG: hypothetical protein ACSHX3_14230 [Litorimonas sp.]
MTPLPKSFWMSLTCTAFLASGCVDATQNDVTNVTHKETVNMPIATVKPGAALEFSSRIDGDLVVGAYTDIEVTISPDYAAGTLQATATGTEGLDILSSNAQLSHDMATGRAIWRVAVRPQDDGLHYLNIMATVSGLPTDEPTARAFSIAIDPGTKSDARDDGNKATIVEEGSENLAVFEAEETILPEK